MSIECRCDECGDYIENNEVIICSRCYNVLIDKIASLEKEIENKIEEAKDE